MIHEIGKFVFKTLVETQFVTKNFGQQLIFWNTFRKKAPPTRKGICTG